MTVPPKHLPRRWRILFWGALSIPSAIGLFFMGLVIAGLVEATRLNCGTRRDWSEVNYVPCSDIDETNPIFFALGMAWLAPLLVTLLILWAKRIINIPQS